VSQGEFAELVDDVVADAEGFGGQAWWVGFGSGEVGLFGGELAGVSAVDPLGVVDGGEFVEQCLKVGDGGGSGSGSQPAFEGLVESFDLALGLGMVGVAVLFGSHRGWR
jgi:hypothetical protein